LKTFEFSTEVVKRVLTELEKAEEFIKISVFQIHLDELFDLLEKKVDAGLAIDIFTLPYDSINEIVSDRVINRLDKLSEKGANLHLCKWNVGDPERTTTAIGRWYSFHGKFIVTDKSAIALSANFTKNNELDAIIVITNEQSFIDNFTERFDELLDLFVLERDGYNGKIRKKIIESRISDIEKVFELPGVIQTTTHQNNWIRHYPATICSNDIEEKKIPISW